MRLTVLGNCGSFPAAGGACSGYLLEAGGLRLLLDCGNGVLSRLQSYCRVEDLDGVIVSHLHFDHMADLLVLQYGLWSKRALGEEIAPLPLYMPATPEEVVRLLTFGEVFAPAYIQDGISLRLGPLCISFARMVHPLESYAVVVSDEGRKLVYSGDTVHNPRLVEIAQGAGLFLCESTALQTERPVEGLPHMTAREAAEVAAQAGVDQLLLTHFWYELPPEAYLAEARAAFGNAMLAEELVTYEV